MQTLFITGTVPSSGKTLLTKILAIYKQTYFYEESLGILSLAENGKKENELLESYTSNSLNNIKIVKSQLPSIEDLMNVNNPCSDLLGKLWKTLNSLQDELDLVLVEGANSLGSPITKELLVSDIIGIWNLPTILIVPIEQNTIHQVGANIALAAKNKVNIKGIILNCICPLVQEKNFELAPVNLIQSLTHVPVLGMLPYIKDTEDTKVLLDVASKIDLEFLFY